MFANTQLQDSAVMAVIIFHLLGWILPCALMAVVGIRKLRGTLSGILSGIGTVCWFIWPFLGCVVSWIGFIVICCFKKREIKD